MPAVQDMRLAVPHAQLDWVVESAFAPLVSRCAGVHRSIACDLRRWRKAPFTKSTRQQWAAFKAALQQEAYDAVIDLQGLSKSALVSWLARTSAQGQRYALANQTEGSAFEVPTRWVADVAITLPTHVHAVQRARLLCAKALGYGLQANSPAQFGLLPGPLTAHSRAAGADLGLDLAADFATDFALRKPVVALVHGASRADKQWPVASWVALGQRLNRCGFCVALMHGSAAEKAVSQAIAAQLEHAWVWPFMALDTLVDAMACCAGVVGVDSGLSHIAVALGLPHVQIYQRDTAWRTGPQHPQQCSVFAAPFASVDAVWSAWQRCMALPPQPCP